MCVGNSAEFRKCVGNSAEFSDSPVPYQWRNTSRWQDVIAVLTSYVAHHPNEEKSRHTLHLGNNPLELCYFKDILTQHRLVDESLMDCYYYICTLKKCDWSVFWCTLLILRTSHRFYEGQSSEIHALADLHCQIILITERKHTHAKCS